MSQLCTYQKTPQPVRGERALWVAVITQAIMDALSRANNSEARYYKNEAINWLTGNSKNFVSVCLNAGFDPDYIRRKAKRTLLQPKNWRAEAGKGKRYLERKEYRKRKKKPVSHFTAPISSIEETPTVIMGPWSN